MMAKFFLTFFQQCTFSIWYIKQYIVLTAFCIQLKGIVARKAENWNFSQISCIIWRLQTQDNGHQMNFVNRYCSFDFILLLSVYVSYRVFPYCPRTVVVYSIQPGVLCVHRALFT
jgi:hypothetical protein